MCRLTSFYTREKSVKGFKVVFKSPKGKYFSPAMGFEYKIGMVPIIHKQRRLTDFFTLNILDSSTPAFSESMVGRTAVFTNEFAARDFLEKVRAWSNETNNFKLVLIQMTIKGRLMEGNYSVHSVIGGEEIVEMKEV